MKENKPTSVVSLVLFQNMVQIRESLRVLKERMGEVEGLFGEEDIKAFAVFIKHLIGERFFKLRLD